MTYQTPAKWHSIAAEIQVVLVEAGTDGMWTIDVKNPKFEDLYIQGLRYRVDSILLQIGNPEDHYEIRAITTKGWREPDDQFPNYYISKPWDETTKDEVVDFLIETFMLLGLNSDTTELEAIVQDL